MIRFSAPFAGRLGAALCGILVACAQTDLMASAQPPLKRMDVDALLRVSQIGDPQMIGWRAYDTELAQYAPGGDRVAVLVRSGNPSDGTLSARLLVYQTADILAEKERAVPQIVAEFAASGNYQPLANITWTGDTSLVFTAARGDGLPQVYRADIASGVVQPLTQETRLIAAMSVTADGGKLLLITESDPPLRPEEDPSCRLEGCLVLGRRLDDALKGRGAGTVYPDQIVFHDLQAGTRREIGSLRDQPGIQDCFPNDFIPGGLSPDGRYGLFFCTRSQWPDWWSAYSVNDRFARMIRDGNSGHARQLVLADLQTGEIRPLNSAPFIVLIMPGEVQWLDGGRRLLLPAAVEPLDGVSGEARRARAGRLGGVLVDPATGQTELAYELDAASIRWIGGVRWDGPSQTLTLDVTGSDGQPFAPVIWQRTQAGWVRRDSGPVEITGPRLGLFLKEGPNDRPVLHAQDALTGETWRLLDPDPWLEGYELGYVEEISWKSRGGHGWDGAIYYPPGYVPGRKYPLVILTHGDTPGKFAPQGYARNYAAQPLAARDMVVLQMNERGVSGVGVTPEEYPRSREGLEGAIDEMDRRGLIDRDRVGLVGWSRTSIYVNHMASHSDYPVRAVMQTDGADLGWWFYLADGTHDEYALDLGAAPFGEGLKQILELSSAFSLHRWQAPLLMWSDESAVSFWDIYAGLRHLGKPVEYRVYPHGTHDIFNMANRRASSELMADWFDFWLNDREDADPEKTAQYARWRILADQYDKVMALPRPPLIEWTPGDPKKRRVAGPIEVSQE